MISRTKGSLNIYAVTSLSKMHRLGGTACAGAGAFSNHRYSIRLASITKLPPYDYAALSCEPHKQVSAHHAQRSFWKLFFHTENSNLNDDLSCGGETPILRMGRTLKGVPPTSGWGSPCARGPPKLSPRTSQNRVGRQRPELAFTEPLSSATTMTRENHHDDSNIQQL